MGLFDIFVGSLTNLGTRHALDLREWKDGYTFKEDECVKFINNKINSMSHEEFLNFLKKREGYRKLVDNELEGKFNKISISNVKDSPLPTVDFAFYPSVFLDKTHNEEPTSYRILDSDSMWDGKEHIKGKFKTLVLIHLNNDQDDHKIINWHKQVRSLSFQYVDLDDDEYKLLEPFEQKIIQNTPGLVKTWGELHVAIHNGIFKTAKRDKFPINRFESYIIFEE